MRCVEFAFFALPTEMFGNLILQTEINTNNYIFFIN